MLQPNSTKISKNRPKPKDGGLNFVCGGCPSAYRSYSSLYLHIKRKHNGIRPPNTKSSKVSDYVPAGKTHNGRPQKPSYDVDELDANQADIEEIQSELLEFMGEKLDVVSVMSSKPKLEKVVMIILEATNHDNDEALVQLKRQVEELFQELKQGKYESEDVEMDFDCMGRLDKKNSLKIICWLLLWLGKYILRIEALKDIVFVFSKVWEALSQKGLEIQYLNNKIVWNEVIKGCENHLSTLKSFQNTKGLLYEFISRICHLIGKVFE